MYLDSEFSYQVAQVVTPNQHPLIQPSMLMVVFAQAIAMEAVTVEPKMTQRQRS